MTEQLPADFLGYRNPGRHVVAVGALQFIRSHLYALSKVFVASDAVARARARDNPDGRTPRHHTPNTPPRRPAAKFARFDPPPHADALVLPLAQGAASNKKESE